MKNVLTHSFSLGSRDCDFTGCWKPSEIFVSMQELAAEHCAMLGASHSVLRAKNLAFALTRAELRMNRYPQINDRVILRTWAAPLMKWMYPRHFLLESESGEILGFASTLWVLLNLEERKMVSPAALNVDVPAGDLPAPLRMPGKALSPDSSHPAVEYLPGYSELDVNGHVNNTRYVAWMCDALGANTLQEKRIDTLLVNYAHELLPGQKVALRTEISDHSFRMSGEREEVNCFSLSGTLR